MVTPTTPLRLSRAVEIVWSEGGMTVSGLRLEAARGRLEIERIAGKDLVTLAAIERMSELCRILPRHDPTPSKPVDCGTGALPRQRRKVQC